MYQSLLFIPANKEKMLKKAETTEADSVIFDLEDSILETDKTEARTILYSFLRTHLNSGRKKLIVRINQLDTYGGDDANVLCKFSGINAFMLPKATVEDVKSLDNLLKEKEKENNLKPGCFNIVPLIESPESLLDARDISMASERITGILFGAEDYTSCMNLNRTTEGTEIFYARSFLAIVCAAAGIDAIDTPCTEITDKKIIEEDARNAKKLGMTGKAAIHPGQLPIINKVFRPDEDELKKAKEIIEATQKSNEGSFSVNGKMVDLPIIEKAKKILETVENMDDITHKIK